ncbi:MAG: hypothetical protein PWP11_3327 [Thauera sp.]|jgi:hypothetical protein|nr:hypothetical protein [Thauera sp.]
MLQSNGACTSPCGAMACPGVGRMERRGAVEKDQYSLGNSSVVTLRSHSVMIQSFRSGATW